MTTRASMDSRYVKFISEQFERERVTRLALFHRQKDNPPPRSRVFDVMKKRIVGGTPKPVGELAKVRAMHEEDHRRKKFKFPPKESYLKFPECDPEGDCKVERVEPHSAAGALHLDKDELQKLSKLPEMFPPPPAVKQQLYEGISHYRAGRYAYLKERNLAKPEDKFPFPLLTSLDYGWKLADATEKEQKKSRHITTSAIQNTFYRRNGIPGIHMKLLY